MKTFVMVVLGFFLLLFQGCGSSSQNEILSGTQKFKFFNARHVTEEMTLLVKKNSVEMFKTSIEYAKDDSRSVSWVEHDKLDISYEQDFGVIWSNIIPVDGMKIILSIGNDSAQSAPLRLDGATKNDLMSNRAIFQVVNAMNGDTDNHINDELELQIRNQSIYDSGLLKLGDVSDEENVIGSANSLVTVVDKRGNILEETTYDILNSKAYIIIIYEDKFIDNQPKIYFLDVTP